MSTSSLSSSFARSFVVFQARDDDVDVSKTSFPKTKRAMEDDDFDEDSRVNDDNNDENAQKTTRRLLMAVLVLPQPRNACAFTRERKKIFCNDFELVNDTDNNTREQTTRASRTRARDDANVFYYNFGIFN
jgi:hypothetical protein